MKAPRNHNDEDVLLDAILADENWAVLDSSLRSTALASLRKRRRLRKVQAWSVRLCVAAVALSALLWRTHPQNSNVSASAKNGVDAPTVVIRNFKEDELLALFPKGSCIVAEVDGQPRFFILDEKRAAEGFAARQ